MNSEDWEAISPEKEIMYYGIEIKAEEDNLWTE